MSDFDERGATRDARTIAYLKEGIARRDKEITRLEEENRELNIYHTGRMNRIISYIELHLLDPHYSGLKNIVFGDRTL